MASIAQLDATWILDSRSNPTVRCEIILDHDGKKFTAVASVPSGASTGRFEALELRDEFSEFGGKGVSKAIDNINETIASKIRFEEFGNALELDEFLLSIDESPNKSVLGANAILAVSMASHRAFAQIAGLELWQYLRRMYFSFLPARQKYPKLMLNIINGGAHADNNLDIQEFMIIPNTEDIQESILIGHTVYNKLKKILKDNGFSTGVGDEGGFAPNFKSDSEALDNIRLAISESGYTYDQVLIAMDVAASEFYNSTTREYTMGNKKYNSTELVKYFSDLNNKYNFASIEDICSEDDVQGWREATTNLGSKIQLVGDDLFVTNINRFRALGSEKRLGNAILIKPNQIGTIIESCLVINKAREDGYSVVISHRSGETSDDFIADLSYACQSDFLKAGAPNRGERVAKYNRLLIINHNLQ
jgi:enolase